jgi:hypothetical protein
MADITMCENEKCPKRFQCHRFTAYFSEYQTLAQFQPDEDGNCEYFWDNTGRKKYKV